MFHVNVNVASLGAEPLKTIKYGIVHTAFGQVILGCVLTNSSPKLCLLKFLNDDADSKRLAIQSLELRFPSAGIQPDNDLIFSIAAKIFKLDEGQQHDCEIAATEAVDKTLIEVALCGTDFQNRVWSQLVQDITWGKQCSYSDLAQSIGQPHAARAVGSAMARNEVAILIPCHRVVAKADALQKKLQYAGGAHIKRQLLDYEATNN